MEITQRIKARLKEVHDWTAVLDEAEGQVGSIADKSEQSSAMFELARACEDIFLDKARAMACYQKAFKLDQKNLLALQHARQIYQQMGHLEMVTRLMGLELKSNKDPERAPALNYAYGTAQLNQGQIDTAKNFLQAAADAVPDNPVFANRFAETVYDRGNWQLALETLMNQLTAMSGGGDPLGADVANRGPDLSNTFLKAARILQQEAAEDPRFLPLLFKALDSDPMNAEAAFITETSLAGGGHLQHIQKLQDRRASLVPDTGVRLGMLIEFANIWQVRLNNAPMAAYFLRQALELSYSTGQHFPGHTAAFRAVKAQGEEQGATDGLIDLAQRGLAATADPDEQVLLAIHAGELAWRTVGDVDTARALLGMATTAGSHPVISAFQTEVGGLSAEAAPVAAPEPEVAPEPEPEVGAEPEPEVAEPEPEAAAEPEPEVAAEPEPEVAAEPEPEVAAEPEPEPEVAAEPEPEPEVAAEPEPEVAAEPEPEVAAEPEPEPEVAAEPEPEPEPEPELPPVEMGDESFTADQMKLIEKAQAAEKKGGKRAIDAWRDAVNKMPEKSFPRERLKGLYIANNKWSNVADLYKDQIKRSDDDAEKEPLYWELLELYRERLRQPGLVVTTLAALEKITEAQGDNEKLLKVVEAQQAQFESMKRWPDLIGRIRRRAELSEDPTQKTELHLQAGNLFLEKFNNQAEAIKSFEAVLEGDEYNAEAIGKLKELYQRRRDWEKMIAVQRKELALIEDPDQKQAQLLEVARMADTKIKKPALSIQLWTMVLETDPDNLEALEHLEHMQEREKDWASLSQTLETLIGVLDDDKKKSQYLVKLGLLYADKVKDNAAAIRTWEALNEIDPNNRRAQDALKKLYLAEGDMDSLEQFYAKQEKWAEFIRVLEREADTAEGDVRTSLTLKIAELYKDRLEKPERAVRAIEKGLGKDENNLTLAERLIELYEEAGDEKNIAGPLGIKLEHTEELDERQVLLARLADLGERVGGDPALAFSYYRRALSEDHTRMEVSEHLTRLAPTTGLWTEMVESFEAACEKFGNEPESLGMRLALADVYENQLGDAEKALATNETVLEIESEEPTALASLERLYLSLGREKDLLEVLNTKLQLSSDDDERRQIQTRVGGIHEQLGNHAAAVEAYNAVLDTGVEDSTVLAALDRMYVGLEKWPELGDILRRELAVVDEEDQATRASLLHRLGVIQQERLEDAHDAVELFHQVLELDAGHADARQRLESWLDNDDHKHRVSTILLPIYEAAEAWPELVRCLDIQAQEESGSVRVELLLRSGAILSQAMNDTGRAFDAYSLAFADDPENESVQQAIEEIVTVDGRWEDYAALYEGAVAKELPTELMRSLLLKLAGVYDQRLSNPEKAVDCYQRAVDIDESNVFALQALENLYQRGENWSELLDVYRRKVGIEEDPSARQTLRFQIAKLQEELLEQGEEAIHTYNEILADDDANMHAIVALDRLYVSTENWSDLGEILGRQLQLNDDPQREIELSLRLGDVRLRRLDQADPAVDLYRRVLELDPNNEAALAALESLLENDDHQLTVAKILEPIYRATNQWEKLIGTFEIMVSRSMDPMEKIGLLHQIGELYEISGEQAEKAFEAYGRALKEDPANEESQRRIDQLAGQLQNYAVLVGLYEDAITDVVDDALSIQVLDKVARIYMGTLADHEKAAGAYSRILDLDPSNFGAIDALVEVHRQNNNFDELVKAVVRKAEMVETPDDRKELLLYAANVRETVMEDAEGAISLYQQVLGIDDADPRALEALERLYLGLENWEELKEIYLRKTELAEDGESRIASLRVLGQLYDERLGDVDRAIDTYQGIVDVAPDDLKAMASLDRLYGSAERWHDQLGVLERATELAPRPEMATTLRHRMGSLWENELADTARAVEAYREVLLHDPTHADSIGALDRIAHGSAEPMLAAQVLEPFYEQLAEWTKLIDLYQVMAEHTQDPLAKKERLHQVAGIYERNMQEFDKAFDAYAGALEIDPSNSEDTIEQMQRLAEVTGDWQKFSGILSEQAENVLDPQVKTSILKRVATVQLEKLDDVDGAVSRYNDVLEQDPENLEAIEALDMIYGHQERWDDLVRVLQRRISITGDETESVSLQFRMGQIHQMNMNDLPGAIEAYRDILNVDPNHQPTLNALDLIFSGGDHQNEIAEILEPIYYSSERWDALVKLGEVRLGAVQTAEERYEIVQNVAEICERKLGDPDQAYRWWLRGYMDSPTNEQVHMEIERLAEVSQEWGYIVQVGNDILQDEEQSDEVRLNVLGRSARILDEKVQDYENAILAYRSVLELDGENRPALEALDRIYTGAEMHEELSGILKQRIAVELGTEELVELQLRLGDTLETRLGLIPDAIGAYNDVLESDSRNQTALDRLEALYLSQHQWEPLFDTYQKLVDIANTDDDMAGCYQRMAKLAADALEREPDAVDLWGRVLDLRGEDPMALGELATLHTTAERWDDLVEVLERQVYVVEDDASRVAVYQQMGRTYGEKLDRDRNALDAWLNAMEIDPYNVETLDTLKRLYEDSQAWVELNDILHRLVAVGADTLGWERMRDLYAQIGSIQGEYLMATDDSIEAWKQVLQINEADLEALAALEQLYTQEARWQEAIQVLEQKSRVIEDTEQKIDVLMQIASTWEERLEDRVQATGAYLEILEIDPGHVSAAESLENIYRDTEQWESLTELLITRAEVTEDTEQEVLYLQQAAKVFEENLGDLDSAFAVLQAAFNVDYANNTTSRELERIATEANKWGDLLNEYNGLVQQIEDPNEQCELWVKIGRWYGEHLDRPDYGIQSLHRALELNPESVNALRELANFHRRSGDATELAATLAAIVPLEQEPETQATTLLDLARTQEGGLADYESSIASYRQALEIDPESMEALEALARLHEAQAQWPELVAVLDRRAQIIDEPEIVLGLRKQIGAVQRDQLGDAAAAIETYKDIVASEPTDREALQALELLYLAGGSIDEYLETLESELDATAEVDEQVLIYDKMASALVEHSDDRDRAAEVLEKIVMLDPQRDVTYRQLEELYTALERWAELVDTYRNHAESSDDPELKIAILLAMGEVHEKQIQDVDRAIDTYTEILELDPEHFEAANTLSRLQETIEDWPAAVETMGRLVELNSDPGARLELLTRMGRVYFSQLEDQEAAELRLNEALAIDPGHVPALRLLADIYKARMDWMKAARTLQTASESSENNYEKTNLAAEAGFIFLEELEDRESAESLFAAAIEIDPEHVEVGRRLSAMYYAEENYEAAAPIYEMLARKADQLEVDDEELRDMYLSAAYTARVIGDGEKALKHYKAAHDVDSTNHSVLVGMADLLFEQEDWEKAFKLYQTILVQHRDSQSDDDTVLVYYRLGSIKRTQGEGRKALNYMEKALEVQPHNRGVLESVIELQSEAGDWEAVIQAKRAITDMVEDDTERFDLYKEIGALYVEKLENRSKAAESYMNALDLRPTDYPLLHTLLELHTGAKEWQEAIGIIDRIVEIEDDPVRRSRYNYTAGVLYRDNLGSDEDAIDRLNTVLDDDPNFLKAFQAIDSLVTNAKDWKTLERSYRKMLKRLPAEGADPLKLTLWNNLGEIYRTRLNDYKSAAAAFEIAARLDPGRPERHVILAELYERLLEDDPNEYVDQAVREHQILIGQEPFRTESYHALYKIYRDSQQLDKAYCVAATLAFLKKANNEQQGLYDKYRPAGFVQARQRLSEETMRKHVFHPDQDHYLTAILGTIAPALAGWRASDLPPSMSAADRVDIQVDPSLFARMAKYVKDVLNVTPPDVYLRPQDPGDLQLMNVKRDGQVHPTMVVFQSLLKGKKEQHLSFALGRHMMDLYPPSYAYVSLDRSTQNLKQVFMACLRICGVPVQGDTASMDSIAREIVGRLPAAAADQMRSLMKKFIDAGGSTDVKRWAAAIELTAYRVGLLLCADLATAALMVSQEQGQLGSAITPKDKIKELVLYSISEDYFEARRHIGLKVG